MKAHLNNVDVQDGYYGIIEKKNNKMAFCPVGRSFKIEKILKNFENGEMMLYLSTKFGKKTLTGKILKKDIDSKGLKELNGKGFDFKTASMDVVQSAFTLEEEYYISENSIELCHSGVGWETVTEENDFEGLKSPLGAVYKWYPRVGNIKSEYRGDMDIKPRGNKNEQIEFIKSEIQGFTPCEVAVSLGLSAVVNGLISDIAKTPNLVVHLYGDSSTGKTTAAQLAVSVAGIPDFQGTTLMKSWNATDNSIISRCKGNRGMPIAMDEISKYAGKDISKLIYALSDGRDKERLNRDASLKEICKHDSFLTTIVSTGEASALDKCNNNTGLKARIIEINAQFTKDANHSNRIKIGCSKNCGWLAPTLAGYMQKKGMDYILKKYNSWVQKYSDATTIDTLKDRIAANYAIILTAADLANEAFGFDFDLNAMIDFFVANEANTSPDRDLGEIAYEKLIDFAKSNYQHFIKVYHRHPKLSSNSVSNGYSTIWGRIDLNVGKKYRDKAVANEYCFSVNSFDEIIAKLKFEDKKVVLSKLKAAGYLNHEKGKLYRKRKLRDDDIGSTKMYVIREFLEEDSDE